MAEIAVEDGMLVVTMHGADKLWALKSRLEVPLIHVKGAGIDPDFIRRERYRGIRTGGTSVPGVITAGTLRQHGDWVFWDVHDPEKAVIIELADERFARLVVQVDDPFATVAVIQRALGQG